MSDTLAAPHHDGSALYVLETPAELGDTTTVRLRVPCGAELDAVAVRYVRDGEPHVAAAEIDEESEHETWWRVSFRVENPVTSYRWLLSGGRIGYGWVTGEGFVGHDVPDADDFVSAVGGDGPAWHADGVVYQVYPDRFARSGIARTPPAWAVSRDWDETPTGFGPDTPLEWFGGDLPGVEAHLDHLARLGASVLYLTPFFPARSTHRYNATSFDEVDPLLGGDEALVSLVRAAEPRKAAALVDQIRKDSATDPAAAARLVKQRFPDLASCIGSPEARSRLNKSLRWLVANNIRVLTPQLFIDNVKLCDEDVDLGLEYTLANMLARHGSGQLTAAPAGKPAPAAAHGAARPAGGTP